MPLPVGPRATPKNVVVSTRSDARAPLERFRVSELRSYEEEACVWVRGIAPVDALPAGRSGIFAVGEERFEFATSVARIGLASFDGKAFAAKTLHCLFDRPPPAGREPKPVTLLEALNDEDLQFTAHRRCGTAHAAQRAVQIDAVLRVLHRGPTGAYHVRPLPEVHRTVGAEDLEHVLEGGRWHGDVRVVEVVAGEAQEEGEGGGSGGEKVARVKLPEWGPHHVLWSNGIGGADAERGAAAGGLWRFEVKLTHPSEESFGMLRAGIVPDGFYQAGGMAMLDCAAAIDHRGVCCVAKGALQLPPVDPETLLRRPVFAGVNECSVEVYVDTAAQTVAFVVGEAVYFPMALKGTLMARATARQQQLALHPFATLQYLDDAAEFVAGGVAQRADAAGEEDVIAAAFRRGVTTVFEYYDADASGTLSPDEIHAFRQRARNSRLAALRGGGVHPRYVTLPDLLEHYRAHPDALPHDYESTLPRRVDPRTRTLRPKHEFTSAEDDWDTAAPEDLPEPPPPLRLPTADGQTWEEHREGGGSLEGWLHMLDAAEAERRVGRR